MNFNPTHNMKVIVKGKTYNMPVEAAILSDGFTANVVTKSGKVLSVSTQALTKR